MGLTLTERDLGAIDRAADVLLSPLDTPGDVAWPLAVARTFRDLLGADRATLMLPSGAGMTVHSEDLEPATLAAYATHFHALDAGAAWLRRRGVEVCDSVMLECGDALRATEWYVDFLVAHRLFNPLTLCVDPGTDPHFPRLFCHHERATRAPFGERGLAIARMLRPAFRAGVRLHSRYALRQTGIAATLDAIPDGMLLWNAVGTGRLLHANRAFERLAASDPEGGRLRREALRTATSLAARLRSRRADQQPTGSLDDADCTLRTVEGTYRLRGSIVGPQVFGVGPLAMVVVERVAPVPLSDEALAARHGLTPRECVVARLLARGISNADIARALGVSARTARTHTEHIFRKLGVEARAQVGPALGAGEVEMWNRQPRQERA